MLAILEQAQFGHSGDAALKGVHSEVVLAIAVCLALIVQPASGVAGRAVVFQGVGVFAAMVVRVRAFFCVATNAIPVRYMRKVWIAFPWAISSSVICLSPDML